jgi:hypothetical protein
MQTNDAPIFEDPGFSVPAIVTFTSIPDRTPKLSPRPETTQVFEETVVGLSSTPSSQDEHNPR